jgi:hypothetical protein
VKSGLATGTVFTSFAGADLAAGALVALAAGALAAAGAFVAAGAGLDVLGAYINKINITRIETWFIIPFVVPLVLQIMERRN